MAILGNVRSSLALLLAATLAASIIGCEGYVRRGSSLYADGRYIEAAEVFERTEQRLPDTTPRERAEYGLYRGMTFLVLGDLQNAHRWMAYAYEVERSHRARCELIGARCSIAAGSSWASACARN